MTGEDLARFLEYSTGWQAEATAAVREAAIAPMNWKGSVQELDGLRLKTRSSGRVTVQADSSGRKFTLRHAS